MTVYCRLQHRVGQSGVNLPVFTPPPSLDKAKDMQHLYVPATPFAQLIDISWPILGES